MTAHRSPTISVLLSLAVLPILGQPHLPKVSTTIGTESQTPMTVVFADNFTDDPNVGSRWRIYRNSDDPGSEASWDETNGTVYVTRATERKAAAMFANYQLTTRRWMADFDYQIGGGCCGGSDGLTFMFYKRRLIYYPGYGGALGFQYFPYGDIPGYGLEFDGYQNSEYADPSANYVGPIQDNVANHLIYKNDSRTEDDAWHHVQIRFDNGSVAVDIDGAPELSYVLSNPDYTYGGIGFSAATGGGANNNHVIDNFVLRAAVP